VFLAGSFWFVQGVQAEKYRNLSEANALRLVPVPAKRGLILDRSGQKILADNQPAYRLTLDRVVMSPSLKAIPRIATISSPSSPQSSDEARPLESGERRRRHGTQLAHRGPRSTSRSDTSRNPAPPYNPAPCANSSSRCLS
jgi:penicillin-binding protein